MQHFEWGADMTCDRCTRAVADACVGEVFCAALVLSDEDACRQAADICISWWLMREDKIEIDPIRSGKVWAPNK